MPSAACDQCHRRKYPCTEGRRPCERCVSKNLTCTYSTGKLVGKPKGHRKRPSTTVVEQRPTRSESALRYHQSPGRSENLSPCASSAPSNMMQTPDPIFVRPSNVAPVCYTTPSSALNFSEPPQYSFGGFWNSALQEIGALQPNIGGPGLYSGHSMGTNVQSAIPFNGDFDIHPPQWMYQLNENLTVQTSDVVASTLPGLYIDSRHSFTNASTTQAQFISTPHVPALPALTNHTVFSQEPCQCLESPVDITSSMACQLSYVPKPSDAILDSIRITLNSVRRSLQGSSCVSKSCLSTRTIAGIMALQQSLISLRDVISKTAGMDGIHDPHHHHQQLQQSPPPQQQPQQNINIDIDGNPVPAELRTPLILAVVQARLSEIHELAGLARHAVDMHGWKGSHGSSLQSLEDSWQVLQQDVSALVLA